MPCNFYFEGLLEGGLVLLRPRNRTGIPYLEDFILVRFKRVQLQLEVPQVPQSHSLREQRTILRLMQT